MSFRLPRPADLVLGSLAPPLPWPAFRLRRAEQAHHAVVFGRTGSGKSKLLQSLFLQHLQLGHGVALLEPHHDLSFDTLSSLIAAGFFRAPDAYERLVYLDWGNGDAVPFNVLAHDAAVLPQTVAANVYEAMLRAYPELIGAPRFKRLFISALLVLLANRRPITGLYRLLTDPDFRAGLLTRVEHAVTRATFAGFERLKPHQQEEVAESVLNRAHHLAYSPYTELPLGQPENWLNFRALMDQGRAVILNLGHVADPEARRLLGALLLVQIEQAALSRTDQLPQQRRPFTVIVDEWQAFAAQAETLGTILSQARKFQLTLYLAAQSLVQVDSRRLAGALENCRLSILFGLGHQSAQLEAREIGTVDPYAVKEAGLTETQHAQYLSLAEQHQLWADALKRLPPRHAYVTLHPAPPVRIQTVHVPAPKVDPDQLAAVLEGYRKRYQRPQAEAQAHLNRLAGAEATSWGAAPAPAAADPPAPARAAYTRLFQARTADPAAGS